MVVERVTGRAEIHTGDGSIRVTETSGELLAETSDGNMQIDDVSGRVETRTGDGSIRLTRHADDACARGQATDRSRCGSATARR